MKKEDFIGLTKKGAQNLAEAKNLIFRLIKKGDEKYLDYPEDTRDDRVCIELDKEGHVTEATFQ